MVKRRATARAPVTLPRGENGRWRARDAGEVVAEVPARKTGVARKAIMTPVGSVELARGEAQPAGPDRIAKRKRAVAKKPAAGRKSATRWGATSEKLFLAKLAETANVRHAALAAGCSNTHIYRLRQKSEDFRAKWAAALREGYAALEAALLDRALNGVRRAGAAGAKKTATEFNDRTALALLTLHRGAVKGAVDPVARPDAEKLRAELAAKLSEMNKRMGGAG